MHSPSFTPSRCHIDLAALTRNFARLGAADSLLPVIKGDAYGHGLLPVAHALDKACARHFAVGTVAEGVALRDRGFGQQVVPLLGALCPEDWYQAQVADLTIPLGNLDDIMRATSVCPQDKTLRVAIKCDTGMSRLGFGPSDLPAAIERLRRFPRLRPVLAISHLACADMPEELPFTHAQMERFASMCEMLTDAFPGLIRSLDNSAALLHLPESRMELCRPGLALYGGNPFHNTDQAHLGHGLEWVMQVSAPIINVHTLAAGASISYGRTYTALEDMTVAVVAAGYATGVARALSNHCDVLINGRRCPQIGRVCMSMMMVDVSALPHVQVGDEAWLMGGEAEPGQRPVSAQELADILGTIPYEILCLMGATNPRVYH